ncbi:terpene synthase family protein [Solwaraspora sp. WMMD1047]|uniref:terpene synthase family protein n=1 Tax=Solwaraspora sp. WMMD1047 TaxID=3016102 RepID=UPI002417EAF4|nr:terpene synthase family protein [Solwaraspora sp. WMMD1047]MDG4830587.1 terpene synthase family protein [Solwaraspora sp. WMMD1047]
MTVTSGLPRLELTFDNGRYPSEDLVRARARTIYSRLEAHGLTSVVPGEDVMVDLICRISPQASADNIFPAAEWVLWIFPLDDLLEDVFAAREVGDLTSIGSPAFADPALASALPEVVVAGVREWYDDVVRHMSHGWVAQFRQHLDSFVLHAVRYAGSSTAARVTTFEEFVRLRREEGAAKPTIDLIEVAARADLPREFRDAPPWRELRDICADVLTWTNDIYSYRKERSEGRHFNLVEVLSRCLDLSEDAAKARAVAMTNDKAQEFIARAAELSRGPELARLPADVRAGVLRCVRGMESWMQGQYEWFTITMPARYHVAAMAEGHDV